MEAGASTCLAIRRMASGVPWLLRSTAMPLQLCSVLNKKEVSRRLSMPRGEPPQACLEPLIPYHPTITTSSVHYSYHKWTALFSTYNDVT